MLAAFVIGGILIFMLGSIYLSGRFAANAKKDMHCIAFKSQDSFLEVRGLLKSSGIFFSDMEWSPSQTAYNTLGTAKKTPKEIWVNLPDYEKAKALIEASYETETIPTALIVRERKTPTS